MPTGTRPNTPVEGDDEALIIEPLKMETPIYVPCDGTVTEIKVEEGDVVEEDDSPGYHRGKLKSSGREGDATVF